MDFDSNTSKSKYMTFSDFKHKGLYGAIGFLLAFGLFAAKSVAGQVDIAFVSDTQAPMRVEKMVLKYNQNERATRLIFHDIFTRRPSSLVLLGDVVSLGYKEKKWLSMDQYLDSCRQAGIHVSALLGNHDVMTRPRKGESKFQQRFPTHEKTGFYRVIDSVAIVYLNSNFRKLSPEEIQKQQTWLRNTLTTFDNDASIQITVVACHHAPYSNSKIVGSSKQVQRYFVPYFLKSTKARLFLTGHSHNYEHFKKEGKDFLVIGGGGGLHQPVSKSESNLDDFSGDYKPHFHYLNIRRTCDELTISSRFLRDDFAGFETGNSFTISTR